MKTTLCILALTGLLLTGCAGGAVSGSPTPPATASAPHAYPQGSIKKGDLALCAVCAVNDGATEKEPAHEVIEYEGKSYSFCNQDEKAKFISEPAKFASK